jgi:GNAT superfamily N-acetyltransferase
MVNVRPIAAGDVPAVAGALARAFDDDPVWQWIFPDERSRIRRLTRVFEVDLRAVYLRMGTAELAGRANAVEAAALWNPPQRWRVGAGAMLRQALPMARAFGTRLPTGLRVLAKIERLHPAAPHWYLSVLGADPAAQGAGLGGALLRSRLDRCDADRMPAYLESSKDRNVPYYERFGFTVTHEVPLAADGPRVWLMWREPHGA